MRRKRQKVFMGEMVVEEGSEEEGGRGSEEDGEEG